MKRKDLTDRVPKKFRQLGADLAGVVSFESLNACPVGEGGKDDD